MSRASLAVLLFAAVAASAADPGSKPSRGFLGEGGGYKASDKATDDYLVGGTDSGQADASAAAASKTGPSAQTTNAPAPEAGSDAPASGQTEAAPATDAPSSAASAEKAPAADSRPAASGASTKASSRSAAREGAEGAGVGRRSLWNGLVQPLAMTASSAADETDPDAASAGAARDYETRVLGVKGSPARPSLGARGPAPRPASGAAAFGASVASARAGSGKVFVSLAIDPREAGSLRDAVAGLGAATGFAADARFEAMPGPGGTVMFSGWIPAGRLGDALDRPGVKSLRVETSPRPSAPRETSGEFLVGIRLDDAARAREGVDAGVAALTSAAGFRLTRIVGLETAPDGRAVAVVSGFLPLSRLSRAMGLSEVAKIVPVGGESEPPAPAPASAPAPSSGSLTGFAGFVLKRGPWLIILTLALLLPGLRSLARRAAQVFNPYR